MNVLVVGLVTEEGVGRAWLVVLWVWVVLLELRELEVNRGSKQE